MSDTHRPDFKRAANSLFHAGFPVIPLVPGNKIPAVKWDDWQKNLSCRNINRYWDKHPDHEVGCILGDGIIVFDADTPLAISALEMLEQKHGLIPRTTVITARGEHHYFRRAADIYAKSDSHDSEKHPERIDIKTGRAIVAMPPSTGKEFAIRECEHVDDLSVASQAFIDDVFLHNGRQVPRPPAASMSPPALQPDDMDKVTREIHAMLQVIDPDCGYDDWLHVGMAVYHETSGSDEGYKLFNGWSSKGSKYRGEHEVLTKWRSFDGYNGTPITIGTLRSMVQATGHDWIEICSNTEPGFEVCEDKTIVVRQCNEPTAPPVSTGHPLARYSLRGRLKQLEKEAVEQVLILGELALLGQITVFYAAPNTGKTLLTLWLLIRAIKAGVVDPAKVYYINVDDSLSGLIRKLGLAERHGFHMLAEGHGDFRADEFLEILSDLIDKGLCKGVVIILDTLKKFTDIMSKRESTGFSKVIRAFVMQGGTCIALAHVNKNPGKDGRPVYAGTSDIIEDADCAYTLHVISDPDAPEKVVEFNNIKRRGDVCQQAAYRYSTKTGISYSELLHSISAVEEEELLPLHQAKEIRFDAEAIEAISQCIQEGISSKMDLVSEAAKRSGLSRRATIEVVEKYTGADPAAHRWTYAVGERGAKIYRLLDTGTPPDTPEDGDS